MKDTMGMITDGGSSAATATRVHSPLGALGEKLANTYGKDKDGQRKMADEYLNKQLQVGDKWYLINSAWFLKWKTYIGLETSLSARDRTGSPDKICNSSLLTPNGQSLLPGLTEENDYFTICEELWWYLVKVYSITSQKVGCRFSTVRRVFGGKFLSFSRFGKDIIERFVIDDAIEEDSKGFSLRVEIRRLNVNLSCSYSKEPSSVNRVITEEMSRQTTMEEVIQRMKNLFEVPTDRKVRLFYKTDNDHISKVGTSSTDTLNSTGYSDNDVRNTPFFSLCCHGNHGFTSRVVSF